MLENAEFYLVLKHVGYLDTSVMKGVNNGLFRHQCDERR